MAVSQPLWGWVRVLTQREQTNRNADNKFGEMSKLLWPQEGLRNLINGWLENWSSSRNTEMTTKTEECDFHLWEGLTIPSRENDTICSLLHVSNWNHGSTENSLCSLVAVCFRNETLRWDLLHTIKNPFEILPVLTYDQILNEIKKRGKLYWKRHQKINDLMFSRNSKALDLIVLIFEILRKKINWGKVMRKL